jgi:hypothetical protein
VGRLAAERRQRAQPAQQAAGRRAPEPLRARRRPAAGHQPGHCLGQFKSMDGPLPLGISAFQTEWNAVTKQMTTILVILLTIIVAGFLSTSATFNIFASILISPFLVTLALIAIRGNKNTAGSRLDTTRRLNNERLSGGWTTSEPSMPSRARNLFADREKTGRNTIGLAPKSTLRRIDSPFRSRNPTEGDISRYPCARRAFNGPPKGTRPRASAPPSR